MVIKISNYFLNIIILMDKEEADIKAIGGGAGQNGTATK